MVWCGVVMCGVIWCSVVQVKYSVVVGNVTLCLREGAALYGVVCKVWRGVRYSVMECNVNCVLVWCSEVLFGAVM